MKLRPAPMRSIVVVLLLLAAFVSDADMAHAESPFEISLNREAPLVSRSDRRVNYEIKAHNVSGALPVDPSAGETLFCAGELAAWGPVSDRPSSYSIEWLRNGEIIPGESGNRYAVTAADREKEIQCLVTATNSAGSAALPSLPAEVVDPQPAVPPPNPLPGAGVAARQPMVTGSGDATVARSCAPPTGWGGVVTGTASTTAGSTTLATVSPGPWAQGQRIVGPGIPANATVTGVGAGTIELSAAATATATGVAVSAQSAGVGTVTAGSKTITDLAAATGSGTVTDGSTLIAGVKTKLGRWAVGLPIVGPGIPAGTTVVAVNTTSLTISQAATSSGSAVDLTAPGPSPFAVGEAIEGQGIPAGTMVAAVGGGTLELSAAATSSGSEITLAGSVGGHWRFRWLRNAREVPGAVSYAYQPTAADEGTVLQCEVSGDNSGGSAVSISGARSNSVVGNLPKAPTSPGKIEVLVDPPALTVEMPSGPHTHIYRFFTFSSEGSEESPSGWACRRVGAGMPGFEKATCVSYDPPVPGVDFPGLWVALQLGPEAPARLVVRGWLSGAGSSEPASATNEVTVDPFKVFGIESFATKVAADPHEAIDYRQAGGHPVSASASFAFPTERPLVTVGGEKSGGGKTPVEEVKHVIVDTPRGFVGNPLSPPAQCPSVTALVQGECPAKSVVGGVTVEQNGQTYSAPLMEMKPEFGAPAQFAFTESLGAVYAITPELRAGDGYAIRLATAPAPQLHIFAVKAVLCSFGVKEFNTQPAETVCFGADEPGASPTPLVTNPTRCETHGPVTGLSVDSWAHPGDFKSAEFESPRLEGCDKIPFEPRVSLKPTSHRADSPTGLDVSISVPTDGLESPTGISQSALKKAVVTLPQGMAVNPSAADGLGACAPAQIKLGTNEPVDCPDSSKIGSAEVVTPLLAEHLNGNVYLARQGDNPFHSLLALYLVVESKERGILVKIPGKVEADPQSGRLVATFDDNPQVPFSSLKLHFNEGNRAPLLNPPACGSYGIVSQLSPWSAPAQPRNTTSTFQVTEGPNGGACPSGGLAPKLEAGLQNPVAGTTSPFVLRLSRDDGTQRFRALDVAMPPGLTAYLRGVPYCPDAALASVSEAEGTGRAQIASPSCPAASQIGTVSVGAGGGSNPFYVNTGRAYLAGPYKGAPLSIAIVTPAVAGPFDLGSVVVRSAVHVDLETARITVDSDPIPTILHGIPLDVRDIRVRVDRPHFTLAPTNCEATAVGATVTGAAGATATPSNHFQVGNCGALRFKPKLKLQLKGATRRIGHPALKAVLTARPGEAGIARAQVNLPHGEFLDQGNLNKTCTRPVLMAGKCPKSSIYGRARAWTPLLDRPLEGYVYLVGGYGYKLPALVADLNGQIRITLVGKVDSGKNRGIRNTFEVVPDAPVSRFVLKMKGGKKYGLLENSENLCKAKKSRRRAIVRFRGQNGKVRQWKPVVTNECRKHKKSRKHTRSRKGRKAK